MVALLVAIEQLFSWSLVFLVVVDSSCTLPVVVDSSATRCDASRTVVFDGFDWLVVFFRRHNKFSLFVLHLCSGTGTWSVLTIFWKSSELEHGKFCVLSFQLTVIFDFYGK